MNRILKNLGFGRFWMFKGADSKIFIQFANKRNDGKLIGLMENELFLEECHELL